MKDNKSNEEYEINHLGKVIRILDRTRLIINVGKDAITVGDEVLIFSPLDIIKDLDGNILGVFENVKATLKVTYTSDNYSVCSDIHEETYSMTPVQPFPNTNTRLVTKPLPINSEDIEPLSIEPGTYKIQLGDLVKKG